MIPKHIKENFINRELDTFDWLKDISEKELDDYIDEIAPGFKFKTPLYRHQKVCFAIGLTHPNFYFMLDMGLGKSLVTLALMEFHKSMGRVDKALIVAPKSQHLYTWEEEVKKHSNLSICVLDDSTKNRELMLDNVDADLFVVNYPGLNYLTCDNEEYTSKKTGKLQNRLAVNSEKIDWLADKFQGLVLDEAQKVKNHDTLSFQACKRIGLRTPYRYLLSGTPFGRDPQDLWSQFNILDHGETLGKTLGIYRECFFTTKKNYWGGYEYNFIKKMEGRLHETIKNRSIWYAADECQQLPDQIYNVVHVPFTEETQGYYDKLIQEIRANNDDFVVCNSAFIKMRMLTSGFIGFVNEAKQERVNVNFKINPKLDALLEVVDNIPKDKKFIIFNEFINSGEIISKALADRNIKHERLYGGTKDVKGALDNFKDDPKCRAMVCNNSSGAEGLNLQIASYTIYYELPLSTITYQQSLKRTHRNGQKNTCFYYYMLVKGSVDEKIYDNLQNGQDGFKAIINGL